jgi:HK97 family phage portal protein
MSLRSWFASRFGPRAAGDVPAPLPNWLIRHPHLLEAGVAITAETATQVSAVYGCCRLIVDCLASAPIEISELRKGGARESCPDDPVGWTLNHGAPIAQAPDAPTSQAIEEALYWSALLYGNGYAEIQWDRAGRFFALWPIEPERVQPWRDETGFYYRVSQPLSLGSASYGGSWTRVEPRDMFHLRGPSLFGWVGDSPIWRASKAIGIGQAAQVFSAAYFANGTVISGLLTSDKNITPEQAAKAKTKWTEEHGGGPGKQHGISVLGQGLKFEPINHNAQEAQLIEARRFQVHEIARFFGVPTTLLADNEAWTNLEALWDGFYRQCLKPWASRFDEEATRKMFPQRQPWREVHHDLTQLTLGSFKDQVAALVQATGNRAVLTQNEARDVLGRNSVPGGDKLSTEPTQQQPKALPSGAEPEEPPDDKPAPVNTRPNLSARDAITAMFADAFTRHARRIRDDRPRSAEGLAQDCAAAWALAKRALPGDEAVDLAPFADALEQGEPPDKAAERLVSSFWREAA